MLDLALLIADAPSAGPIPDISGQNAETLAVFRSGNPARIIAANVESTRLFLATPSNLSTNAVWMGLFLLGLYAGRARVLEHVGEHIFLLRRVLVWGAVLAVASRLALWGFRRIDPGAEVWVPANFILVSMGAVPLALAYIAGLTLLLQRPWWQRRLAAFAPVGQMALTNYLSQTVLCLLVFYGYGGGLIGRTGAAANLGIALALFSLQMGWSGWWLRRYRFGPVEWLWRSLTYGRVQPMRLAPLPTGAAEAIHPAQAR